jgi:hypothetical protein
MSEKAAKTPESIWSIRRRSVRRPFSVRERALPRRGSEEISILIQIPVSALSVLSALSATYSGAGADGNRLIE